MLFFIIKIVFICLRFGNCFAPLCHICCNLNKEYSISKCAAQGNFQNIKVQVLMAYWQLKYPRVWSHGKGAQKVPLNTVGDTSEKVACYTIVTPMGLQVLDNPSLTLFWNKWNIIDWQNDQTILSHINDFNSTNRVCIYNPD